MTTSCLGLTLIGFVLISASTGSNFGFEAEYEAVLIEPPSSEANCDNEPICGENEKPTDCFEAVCERRNCSDLNEAIRCVRIDPKYCTKGCICEDGYLRDYKGKCIPDYDCPNIRCGTNETYDACPATCPPQRCDVDPSLILCLPNPEPGSPDCEPGCRCLDNYLRNDNGLCVQKNDCPQQCGINEIYDSCPAQCPPERCGVDPSLILCVPNPEPGSPDCKPGCRCLDNYLRDQNGICVPKEECPLVCNGKNEVVGCNNGCPQTCELGNKCINRRSCIRRECRCKPGYYRNRIGECTSQEDCAKCTGSNEYYSCGGACDNVCSTLSKQNQTNCPIINIKCNEMCYCEEGYARDSNNTCIPIKNCPKQQICGVNEVFDVCPAPCPPRRCDVDERVIRCAKPPEPGDPSCKPGCRCADNYYRNDKNVCVPRNECPPKPVVCGPDEVYSGCVNGGCGRWECSQPGIICIDLVEGGCKEGCRCKEGLLRDNNGNCVPADQCPLQCYGENEVTGCQSNCSQTCESIGKLDACPKQSKICKPACRCKENYYRNKIGDCISKKQCLQCTGPHEYYSCGGACDNVCATLSKQNQTNCPIINVKCNEMCYCEEGYARDSNNTCIPIKNCPIQPTCGKNEVYDNCPSTCPPETCASIGRQYKCAPAPTPGDKECKPSCRCTKGYYRNKNGDCVAKDKCPKPVVCGPDEEYTSCVNSGCGRFNCSLPGIICIDPVEGGCKEGCRCKEGLLRDDKGNCIPADRCPLKCYGQNEVSGCQKTCPPETCESVGKIYYCPRQPAPADCKQECRCIDNYYRNKKGDCIPKEQCSICEVNEFYDTCPASCPGERCDVDERLVKCAPPPKTGDPSCKPACRCVPGYLRNSQLACVPKSDCQSHSSGYEDTNIYNTPFTD